MACLLHVTPGHLELPAPPWAFPLSSMHLACPGLQPLRDNGGLDATPRGSWSCCVPRLGRGLKAGRPAVGSTLRGPSPHFVPPASPQGSNAPPARHRGQLCRTESRPRTSSTAIMQARERPADHWAREAERSEPTGADESSLHNLEGPTAWINSNTSTRDALFFQGGWPLCSMQTFT